MMQSGNGMHLEISVAMQSNTMLFRRRAGTTRMSMCRRRV
jgi:hypothetical protein